MTDVDMPALFADADGASLRAQKQYLWQVRVDLSLILIASLFGALSVGDTELKRAVAVGSAVAFGLSVIATAVLGIRRDDRKWFEGRAIAESVKTLAWRYSTKTEPFDAEIERNADERF